jgi:hypothetical protein
MFLADLNWTYFPYSFFQFNDSEITLLSQNGGSVQSTDVTQIPVTNMELVGAQTSSPSIVVNKGNSDFNYSEILTVSPGVSFANMTIVIQSNAQNVSLDWVNFVLNSQGAFLQPSGNTVAMLDVGMKECGQLIFVENQPEVASFNSENPCVTELSYNLQGKSSTEIQMLVGIYPVSENDILNQANLNKTLMDNVQNAQKAVSLPITTFDYKESMQVNSVSYIANRDFEVNPKFADDPAFNLVFIINNEVAIFKFRTDINQVGR